MEILPHTRGRLKSPKGTAATLFPHFREGGPEREREMTTESALVVSFDPGTANLAHIIAKVSQAPWLESPTLELWEAAVSNVSTRAHSPDITRLLDLVRRIELSVAAALESYKMLPTSVIWVIEYQPPLNTLSNPGLVRKNTWVEAFLQTYAHVKDHAVSIVASSAVKQWFRFPKVERSRQYASNKTFAIEAATQFLGANRIPNDHVADCVLNAIYAVASRN